MGISWQRQMSVLWQHRELAHARDQLEAKHWGLSEADGCVEFGSQKLCKTCLAGLSGLASRVGHYCRPGLQHLCMALWVFLEVLEAKWHSCPSVDHNPFAASLPPTSALTFYPSCLCCCYVDRRSLPQSLYACRALCQMSLVPLLFLISPCHSVCESFLVHPI